MKHLILALSILILTLSHTAAYAQEGLAEDDFTAGSDIIFNTDQDNHDKDDDQQNSTTVIPKDAEVTIMEDEFVGEYANPSVENLSKLYWKKNALKLESNSAVDNFLMINECDIHTKFYTDDFEWLRIRDAAREMIKDNKDEFPEKFKIVVPIDLGRYDMKKQGFPLINKTAFKDLRRVEIGGNKNGLSICNQVGAIDNYPKNVILILNRPFNFDFFQLDEHIAQAYIIRQKYGGIERPDALKNNDYDRLAFARIRIHFSKYQGSTKGADNYPVGIMFGRLDGIDIFEDAFEKHLLKSISFDTKTESESKPTPKKQEVN